MARIIEEYGTKQASYPGRLAGVAVFIDSSMRLPLLPILTALVAACSW